MSLDIGEGTKPLFRRDNDDTDDESELTNKSESCQSEEGKLSSDHSQNETDDKDTETENDEYSKSDDNEEMSDDNDESDQSDAKSDVEEKNDDDKEDNSDSSENDENSEQESEDDEKDDEELPEVNQKTIQEPKESNQPHRHLARTQYSRVQHQQRSQSKPASQDSKQQSSEMSSRYSKASSANKGKDLHELATHYQPLPTNNVLILKELIDTLYEERKQKALNGDFEGSVSLMRAIDHTKEYLNIAEKRAFQRKQKYEVSKENNKVQSRIAKFDQETAKQEKELKKNIAKSREKLINDLRLEGQQQEEYWQSESHMRLYNRPSHKLRALRYQANQMVACGRFKDAEEVMKVADQLQQQEQRQGAYQMQKDYENATKLFDQRVKDELNTFDIDAVNQIENLRARRATMRTVFQNQEKKVEQRSELVKDVDRCWNANMRTIVKEKMSRRGQNPDQLPRTTRALGRSLREKQDKIVLALPKLNTKKVMEKPIPAPDYL